MAKQSGVVKYRGTLDDVTYYQTANGFMARRKAISNKSKIEKDPAYARVRENNAEFKLAAEGGKLLRSTLRSLLRGADGRMPLRLTKLMMEIKNLDASSVRGERSPGLGLATANGKALLKGFNFSNKTLLENVLLKPYSFNSTTGVITIAALIPKIDFAAPITATHVTLRGAWANIDFSNGVISMEETNAVSLALNSASTNVTLTPAGIPVGAGVEVFLLHVEFFQEVNGVQYPLNNGGFNCVKVVDVV